MNTTARVESIDALRDLRAAVLKFVEQVRVALDEAGSQARRAQTWVQRDQAVYWQAQIRRRQDEMNRARLALLAKQAQKAPDGGGPSCVEERKALELARRRLEQANQKAAAVRQWIPRLEREVHGYMAVTSGLGRMVDLEGPRVAAQLDGMIDALERYLALSPPTEARAVFLDEAGLSVAREGAMPPDDAAPTADHVTKPDEGG